MSHIVLCNCCIIFALLFACTVCFDLLVMCVANVCSLMMTFVSGRMSTNQTLLLDQRRKQLHGRDRYSSLHNHFH